MRECERENERERLLEKNTGHVYIGVEKGMDQEIESKREKGR